jgi:sec-independent protein translocase protein TatA
LRLLRKINDRGGKRRRSRGTLDGMGSGLVSPWHIAVLAVALLLIFGPARLPEMGRSLGRGIREFRDSASGAVAEAEHEPDALPAAQAREHDIP